MINWIYPEVIADLIEACNDFINGKITAQEIQSKIYGAENQIVAIDEKWLRELLFNAENEIELLIYTVDEGQLQSSVMPIVQNILSKIK
ncbi:hypothetical protein J2X14_004075 [Pantoea alhagi]|uniref:hypothetical protein n=1 Tax=Mixta sp. BE291 TaxID=3158787 RepID=UPI00285799D6|nr:hypothetical protein [Pantoea alhagi]